MGRVLPGRSAGGGTIWCVGRSGGRIQEHRQQLQVLTRLEAATKELAEPVFQRRGLDRGIPPPHSQAAELAAAVAEISWEEFVGSIEPITAQFLEKYLQLVDLAADEEERAVAEAYVAHELALAAFARRALGKESGDPLELILALPHLARSRV